MDEANLVESPGALATGTGRQGMHVPIPPVPPPKDQPISRYHSLRGKSVSSPRRNNNSKAFDIYRDQVALDDYDNNGSDVSPTRNRSFGAAAAAVAASTRSGNAAKRCAEKRFGQQQTPPLPTIKSPLNPKPVNLSSPNPTDRLDLPASNSAHPLRPATPEPRLPQKESLSSGAATEGQTQKRGDREEAARWASEVARLEAETDRILAEQKKRDLARLQAQLATVPSPKPKAKRPILDKLTFLRSPRPNAPNQPTTPKSAPAKILAFTWSPATPPADRTPSPESMSMIEPGGKGIVPQTDAPASASNGGERVRTLDQSNVEGHQISQLTLA